MKRIIATLVVASSLAVPALASANATTNQVASQFAQQTRNRARLSGLNVTSTSVRCASDGGGYYSCYGTYTISAGGYHVKYGVYINVTPTRWYTVGKGTLVSTW